MLQKFFFVIVSFLILNCFFNVGFSAEPPQNTTPFYNRSDAVYSPQGSIPKQAKAFSPDNSKYVCELKPMYSMKIGVFDKKTNDILRKFDLAYSKWRNNEIKGTAWSPDSKMVAVMFHHNEGGDIIILNAESGEKIDPIRIDTHYHYMVFSPDGQNIVVSFSGNKNDLHYLSVSAIP